VLGVAAGVALLSAGPAQADPLDDANAEYTRVERQVERLDKRVGRLTEDFNLARWQLRVVRKRIVDSTANLRRAGADLAAARRVLAELLVNAYKNGEGEAAQIILGARSLSDMIGDLQTRDRINAAWAQTLEQIREAEDRIAAEREALQADEQAAEAESRILENNRRRIEARLDEREALLGQLGLRRDLLEAQAAIGSSLDPDEARAWLRADMRLNKDHPNVVLGDRLALEALEQLGVPYVWGGASPKGFDCSGLITWLWANHGYMLPHHAATQYRVAGPQVDRDELRAGDLVFFSKLGHMGMYIGNGYVIDAPRTGLSVRILPLTYPWFEQTWVGAVRPYPLVG
jgi:cell wall-associated NlpC family hydrolase